MTAPCRSSASILIYDPDKSFHLSLSAFFVCIAFLHLRENSSFAMLPADACVRVDGLAG
jgi:hypothetical protein